MHKLKQPTGKDERVPLLELRQVVFVNVSECLSIDESNPYLSVGSNGTDAHSVIPTKLRNHPIMTIDSLHLSIRWIAFEYATKLYKIENPIELSTGEVSIRPRS